MKIYFDTPVNINPPVDEPKAGSNRVANLAGFSLHAVVMAEARQRDKLERLCRSIARPAVSEKRLALLDDGRIRYELKTPYRDGTTHVMLLWASFQKAAVHFVRCNRPESTRSGPST